MMHRWLHNLRSSRAILALTLILALGLLAACGPKAASPSAPSAVDQNPAPAAPKVPTFSVTVTGDDGETVTLEKRPERILSIAPSNTEILFAIGAGDQVVGIDSFSDYPEAATALPRIGGVTDPDFEMMASLQPDLALSIGGTDAIVTKLRELGVPVLVLQPETMTELYDTILRTGKVTGHAEAAEQLISSLEARVDAVKSKTDALTDEQRPGVFYVMWPDPLMTAGPGSFLHDLITVAGGRNIAADAPSAFPEFSHEQVVSRNPDVILVPGPWQAEEADRIKAGEYPGWGGLNAVTNDAVYVVEEDLVTRPGPRLVDGLEALARLLQPEMFR